MLSVDSYMHHKFDSADEFLATASRVGRDQAPELLFWHWLRLDPEVKRAVILGVWELAEFPVRIGERLWVGWFKEVGYVSDGLPQPTEGITVWRGTSIASKGRGMSWTLDRDKVRWFAERWSRTKHDAAVFEATIPPRAILGSTGFSDESRGEREIIVNPNMLRGRAKPMVVDATVYDENGHPVK